jgi:hypothetical protein
MAIDIHSMSGTRSGESAEPSRTPGFRKACSPATPETFSTFPRPSHEPLSRN